MTKVALVTVGGGNVLSVTRAFQKLGAQVEVADAPEKIMKADRLVLPGVGAFGCYMELISQSNLTSSILDFIAADKPCLGICVGMQALFETSEEFGRHKGFGVLEGHIVKIPEVSEDGYVQTIPHVGWYPLDFVGDTSFLAGIAPASEAYFVHSYMATPINPSDLLASYQVGRLQIPALVNRGRTFGCQFHPEKSGAVGLNILNNFLAI